MTDYPETNVSMCRSTLLGWRSTGQPLWWALHPSLFCLVPQKIEHGLFRWGPFLCVICMGTPVKNLAGERSLKLTICSPSFPPWSCVCWWHTLLRTEGHSLVPHSSSRSSVSLWPLVIVLSCRRGGRNGNRFPCCYLRIVESSLFQF